MGPMRRAAYVIIAAGGTALGYASPPLQVLRNYTETAPLPVGNTPAAQEYMDGIERDMLRLPQVRKLLDDPQYEVHRAWSSKLQNERRHEIFTAGTLLTPGGINGAPIVFVNKRDKSSISFLHVGRRLVGFPVIVHGGVLATILDEALGRTAYLSLTANTCVTAKLGLQYRFPTIVEQFLVVKVDAAGVTDDRKATVRGSIATLGGRTLVEGDGLFVVPKKLSLESLKGL